MDTVADRLRVLQNLYLDGPSVNNESLSIESLLDLLVCVYQECTNLPSRRDKAVCEFLDATRHVVDRVKELRLSKSDFEVLQIIGRGAFGEVALVKMVGVGQIYAMKTLNKRDILNRAETARFREERDVLIRGDRKWFTNLHFAFQDEINLYFVMTFYPGGDLLTLMSKGVTTTDGVDISYVHFYSAELIVAIDAVHRIGYIHRDIKPDNVLIDVSGHLRLGDFGSCLKLEPDGLCPPGQSAVGTPDYISPEILHANGSNGRYGAEVDWWSFGIVLYELLFDETPFYSEQLTDTYHKIMNHEVLLDFPPSDVPEEAKDLVSKLVCKKELRLGKHGLEDFRSVPWFNNIDFDNIHNMEPPFRPTLTGPCDTSNFDLIETQQAVINDPPRSSASFNPHHLAFVGFTYTHGSAISDKMSLAASNEGVLAYNERMQELEQEKHTLARNLSELLEASQSHDNEQQNLRQHVAKLLEENSMLKTRLTNENSGTLRHANRDQSAESLEEKISQHKEQIRKLVMEKAEVQRVNEELVVHLEDYRNQCEEALRQSERARSEVEEISNEMNVEKMRTKKLEVELDEREHTLSELNEKLTDIKRNLRNMENENLELRDQSEKLKSELESERIQTVSLNSQLTALDNKDQSNGDAGQLAEELEKLNERHTEVVAQEEAKRKQLVESYQKQLDELQSQLNEKDKEMRTMRSKFDEDRASLALQHEHELKNMELQSRKMIENMNGSIAALSNEKAELQAEVAVWQDKLDRLQAESITMEQTQEFLRFTDELKKNRNVTEAMAKKLSDQIETLLDQRGRLDGQQIVAPTQQPTWGSRRQNRAAQIESLDAQRQLQAEVRSNERLRNELSTARQALFTTKARLDTVMEQMVDLQRENEELKTARTVQSDSNSSLGRRNFFNVVEAHNNSLIASASVSGHDLSEQELPDVISDRPVNERAATGRNRLRAGADIVNRTSASSDRLSTSVDQYGHDVSTVRSEEFSPTYENAHHSCSTSSTMSAGQVRTAHTKAVKSLNNALSGIGHQFEHVTLTKPTKCMQCTSILVGLERQGLRCLRCDCVSHVYCQPAVPAVCPVPTDARRPLGIDPRKGVGTAYEGVVKIPKPGGVRKGWLPSLVAVVDYKLYFYDIVEKKGSECASAALRHVIDMRDPNFNVTGVNEKDAIHAAKNDIPSIFRVSTTLLSNVPDDTPGARHHALLLADTPDERKKWVYALTELRSLYKKSRLSDKRAFDVKGVFDVSTLMQIRFVQCATVINQNRIVLGFTEGLYCAELEQHWLIPVGGEKENHKRSVEKVIYNDAEQLLVVLLGPVKDRHVRIIPSAGLDGRELKWIKVSDTKGCHLVAMGKGTDGKHFIVVAVKKTVSVYQIDRTEKRHHKLKDLAMPAYPQCLNIENGKLVVGFPHGFRVWPLNSELDNTKQISLVNVEDQSLKFLFEVAYEAQMLIDLCTRSAVEYLLVFDKLGVYVDGQGRRSRSLELHFPAFARQSGGFAYSKPHLSVYCDNDVHVFDVMLGEWVQTVNIRNAVPLSQDGMLSFGFVNESPYVVLLHDTIAADEEIVLPQIATASYTSSGKRVNTKKRFNVKTSKDDNKPGDRTSKPPLPISGPSDFVHIVHMGPGSVELKNMIDLPSANSGGKFGGLLRSTSSNSSTTVSSIKPLGGTKQEISTSQKNRQSRPQSTTSRGSDGSSLGRDGTLNSSNGSDNPYLEPMSKTSLSTPSAASPKS